MRDRFAKNSPLKLALQIIGIIGLAVLIFLIRRQLLAVLLPLTIALATAYILNPVVLWMQERRIKRTLAVLIIYLIFFGIIAALGVRFLPIAADEFSKLGARIPQYTQQVQDLLDRFYAAAERLYLPDSFLHALQSSLDELEARLGEYLARIPDITIDAALSLFNFALVLILTFYLLKDYAQIRDSLYMMVPRNSRSRARKIIHEIDLSLGKYIRGQLLLALIIGISTYVSLLILGVDFALILAIIAGITNVIPYFGPFLGAVPAVLVALLHSPALALKTVIVFVIIQQAESHLIAPQVLGKSMGLHPLVVIIALMAGGQFFGIFGMMVAVPLVAVGRILIRNLVVPPMGKKR